MNSMKLEVQISELLHFTAPDNYSLDILSNLVVKKTCPLIKKSVNTKSTYIIVASNQQLHGSGAEQTGAFWNPAQILVAGAQ